MSSASEGAPKATESKPDSDIGLKAFNEIKKLFAELGKGDYIGEDVTQQEHALQCGKLATDAGATDEIVLGALLHDVGHMIGLRTDPDGSNRMGRCGVMNHERLGREWLESLGFPLTTVQIVEGHVQAKRYLCWKNPVYHSKLSDASKTTLTYQGGVMTDAEAKAFETSDLFGSIIKMRSWDEKAKIKGMVVPELDSYENAIRAVCQRTTEDRERSEKVASSS